MRKTILLLTVVAAITTQLNAQAPASAADILKEARTTAARENKKVFILFHASWCGWCHKMDTAMNDIKVKKYFDDNYVVRHMVVYESKGKENLENPGALEMLGEFKGNDQGIPYWLIFDKDGKLLADSKMRAKDGALETGDNIGCPASEPEVDHFIDILKNTSSLDDGALKAIRLRFRENEAKHTPAQ